MDPDVFRVQVAPVLFGLWPRMADSGSTPLTAEQKKAWVRMVGNYSAEQACEALRRVYDDGPKFPEPYLLRDKLIAIYGGQSRKENHISTREREEWEMRQHQIAQIIDGLTDAELQGHAIMYAASNVNLLWTLNLDPRKDKGLRAAIAIRTELGLGPDDEAAPDRQENGKYGIRQILQDAIARAKRIRSGQEPPPMKGNLSGAMNTSRPFGTSPAEHGRR
jgi:hypothetical protein